MLGPVFRHRSGEFVTRLNRLEGMMVSLHFTQTGLVGRYFNEKTSTVCCFYPNIYQIRYVRGFFPDLVFLDKGVLQKIDPIYYFVLTSCYPLYTHHNYPRIIRIQRYVRSRKAKRLLRNFFQRSAGYTHSMRLSRRCRHAIF